MKKFSNTKLENKKRRWGKRRGKSSAEVGPESLLDLQAKGKALLRAVTKNADKKRARFSRSF